MSIDNKAICWVLTLHEQTIYPLFLCPVCAMSIDNKAICWVLTLHEQTIYPLFLCPVCSMSIDDKAIWKVTSGELLQSKQREKEFIMCRKLHTYLKLLLGTVTARIEALVILRNKFLYTCQKEVRCLWAVPHFDSFHQHVIIVQALWSQPASCSGLQGRWSNNTQLKYSTVVLECEQLYVDVHYHWGAQHQMSLSDIVPSALWQRFVSTFSSCLANMCVFTALIAFWFQRWQIKPRFCHLLLIHCDWEIHCHRRGINQNKLKTKEAILCILCSFS
jgi:hypothetical protein